MRDLSAFLVPLCLSATVCASAASAADAKRIDGELDAPAPLQAVTKGVFSLRADRNVDLGDRAMMLTFRATKKCPVIILNGHSACVEIGKRFDLKWPHGPFFLGKLYEDKERCFLDVVSIAAPKGAEPVATFRFYCA